VAHGRLFVCRCFSLFLFMFFGLLFVIAISLYVSACIFIKGSITTHHYGNGTYGNEYGMLSFFMMVTIIK